MYTVRCVIVHNDYSRTIEEKGCVTLDEACYYMDIASDAVWRQRNRNEIKYYEVSVVLTSKEAQS